MQFVEFYFVLSYTHFFVTQILRYYSKCLLSINLSIKDNVFLWTFVDDINNASPIIVVNMLKWTWSSSWNKSLKDNFVLKATQHYEFILFIIFFFPRNCKAQLFAFYNKKIPFCICLIKILISMAFCSISLVLLHTFDEQFLGILCGQFAFQFLFLGMLSSSILTSWVSLISSIIFSNLALHAWSHHYFFF